MKARGAPTICHSLCIARMLRSRGSIGGRREAGGGKGSAGHLEAAPPTTYGLCTVHTDVHSMLIYVYICLYRRPNMFRPRCKRWQAECDDACIRVRENMTWNPPFFLKRKLNTCPRFQRERESASEEVERESASGRSSERAREAVIYAGVLTGGQARE